MKKTLLIALIAVMICGCRPSSPVDKSERLIAEKDKNDNTTFILANKGLQISFKYIVIDDHEYLISTYDRGIGLTHSPNCKCNKRLQDHNR